MIIKQYCVYIMTNFNHTVLYIGVTNDLKRRVHQHKHGEGGKFTSRYHCTKLVYYEVTEDIRAAILREKQLKGGSRQKKIDLVNDFNPEWRDLYDDI